MTIHRFRGEEERLSTVPPLTDADVLPALSLERVRELRDDGWKAVGTLTALVTLSKKVILVEHSASKKTPEGALGPLAETSLLFQGIPPRVETTAETVGRAVAEEFGITSPLEVVAPEQQAAWLEHAWPVGLNEPGNRAFGICPVLLCVNHEVILDEFQPSEETNGVQLIDFGDAPTGIVRPGTQEWLQVVYGSAVCASIIEDPYRYAQTGALYGIEPRLRPTEPPAVDLRLDSVSL